MQAGELGDIFANGNAEQAVGLLEFVLADGAASPRVRNLLAEGYLRTGKAEAAFQLLEKAQERQPEDRQALALAAISALLTERADRARLLLRQLTDLDSRSAEVHYLLALAYQALANPQASRDSPRQALSIDPGYAPAVAEHARLAFADQRIADASEAAALLRTLWPDRAELYDVLAHQALAGRRNDDAATLYQQALERSPTSVRALRLAYAEHRAGRPHVSQSVLTDWLGSHPDDVAVALVLANKHLAANALVEASEVYSIILRQRPDHIVAMNNLAWVSWRLGELEIAEKLASRGLQLSPDNTRLMDTLADIHLSQGDAPAALPLLRRVAHGRQGGPATQLKLARALAQTGNRAEARVLLQQLLAAHHDFPERAAAERLSAQLQP